MKCSLSLTRRLKWGCAKLRSDLQSREWFLLESLCRNRKVETFGKGDERRAEHYSHQALKGSSSRRRPKPLIGSWMWSRLRQAQTSAGMFVNTVVFRSRSRAVMTVKQSHPAPKRYRQSAPPLSINSLLARA